MNRIWVASGALAIAAGLLGALSSTTQTVNGLEICNRSDRGKVLVAVAYPTSKSNWTTQGWLALNNGECNRMLEGSLENRFYYYFATTEGGYTWKGVHRFCVSNRSFSFASADKQCQGINSHWENFRELDTGNNTTDYRLNLE